MFDPEIAKSKGLTVERLKAIFTATPPEDEKQVPWKSRFLKKDESQTWAAPTSTLYSLPENPNDYDLRCYFESLAEARITEGWQRSFDTFRLYAPVDLAMDTTPINTTNYPLILLGQGKIDLGQCADQIGAMSPELRKKIFELDQSGKPFKVNWPKFSEVSYNLVHSLVTRRVAAVSTPIATRYPFLRYDSKSTSQVGKLRAEMMTQYAEDMSDGYGYRHDIVQSVRDSSCYTHQIEFCRASWSKDPQPVKVKKVPDGTSGVGPESTDYNIEEKIVREGVEWVAPHPSRTFWDLAYPLAKLNFDCGPQYVGYWDVCRASDIRSNLSYWNRDAIELNPSAYEFLGSNDAYFKIYYPDTIVFPTKNNLGNAVSMANDRLANIGYYANLNDDVSITKGEIFMKINPKKLGICEYDADVWIRLVVGGSRTVMYAEPMPDSPAVVHHYNENDSRMQSPSFAHAVMPYQDQISNLLTQLLDIQMAGFTKIIELNIDGMEEGDVRTFEDSIKNRQYAEASAILVKYSSEALKDMGVNAQQVQRVRAVELQTAEKTGEIFRTITQLLAFAERLLFFSPQELGQVAPREITATEANMVQNTTLGIRDFHTIGIEEALAAKKRIIYSAAMAFGSDDVTLSVQNRFSKKTVQAAGFQIIETDGDPDTTELDTYGKFTLTGNKSQLVHNYTFTSRDGLDRPSSQSNAANLIQMLQVLGSTPEFKQMVPREKFLDILNEIARNLGGGFDLRLEVPEGQDPAAPIMGDPMQQFQQTIQQIGQALTTLNQKQQQDSSSIKDLAGAVAQLAASITARSQLPPMPNTQQGQIAPGYPVGTGAPPLNTLQPEPVPAY